MSILSGFFKTKKYRKTTDGYKLESNWTSGNTVELDDGNTVQNNLGAIKGITTSTSVTETGYAADATTVAALNESLNSNLDNINSKLNTLGNADVLTTTDSTSPVVKEVPSLSKYRDIYMSLSYGNNIYAVTTISRKVFESFKNNYFCLTYNSGTYYEASMRYIDDTHIELKSANIHLLSISGVK